MRNVMVNVILWLILTSLGGCEDSYGQKDEVRKRPLRWLLSSFDSPWQLYTDYDPFYIDYKEWKPSKDVRRDLYIIRSRCYRQLGGTPSPYDEEADELLYKAVARYRDSIFIIDYRKYAEVSKVMERMRKGNMLKLRPIVVPTRFGDNSTSWDKPRRMKPHICAEASKRMKELTRYDGEIGYERIRQHKCIHESTLKSRIARPH